LQKLFSHEKFKRICNPCISFSIAKGGLKLEAPFEQSVFDVYPNPFTSSATISFSLQQSSRVQIELYDVAGRKLQTVLDENVAEGNHEVNLNREQLSTGIYFLQLKMNDEVVMKKVVIE
jgi:hypothetical protein